MPVCTVNSSFFTNMPWSTWKRLVQKKNGPFYFFLEHLGKCLPGIYLLTSWKVCDWSGYIFGASASPSSLTKKLAMSPSSTVHGGQHGTKYVTFELVMRAAFVADEFWVLCSNQLVRRKKVWHKKLVVRLHLWLVVKKTEFA